MRRENWLEGLYRHGICVAFFGCPQDANNALSALRDKGFRMNDIGCALSCCGGNSVSPQDESACFPSGLRYDSLAALFASRRRIPFLYGQILRWSEGQLIEGRPVIVVSDLGRRSEARRLLILHRGAADLEIVRSQRREDGSYSEYRIEVAGGVFTEWHSPRQSNLGTIQQAA